MSLSRRPGAAVAAMLAAAVAVPATAEPVPPNVGSRDRKAAAKAYADAGLAAHDRGDYDQAIAHYRKAYDLLPHPAMFFNIGQSYRLAGRGEQAIEMYRRYLAEAPGGSLAGQARSWIMAIERDAARGRSEPGSATTEERVAGAGDRDDEAALADAPEAPGRTWRIAGMATAGAGVVAVAAGGLFGLRARSLSDSLSKPGAPYDAQTVADGERAERTMFVCYGVGGAMLIGGAAMYVLGRRAGDRRGTAVAPAIGPDRVGIMVSGSF